MSLSPMKTVIRDYALICESYYDALRGSSPSQIESVDMGRRGLHNEGAELLRARLEGKVEIDKDDSKDVVLRCSKRPEGEVFVTYAHAAQPGEGPYPANRGALRDAWGEGARRRWALPARLKLTGG